MSNSRKQRARVEINKLATSFVAYDEGDPEIGEFDPTAFDLVATNALLQRN